jgi:Fe-S cluster biogenesis protein NfuA
VTGPTETPSDTQPPDLRAVGDHIEALMSELRSRLDPRAWERVETLVGLVTDLYGGGLERVLALVDEDAAKRLVNDDLVSSLLILHGLHPLGLEARVTAALDSVRPYLASHGGDVEVLALDADEGRLLLRMLGSCDGCPSSSVTLQLAVREAVEAAAPEIVHIDLGDDASAAASPAPAAAAPTPIALTRKPVRAS